MSLNFSDPMAPFKETFARLLAPKSLVDPSPRTNSLQYFEDGTSFDISSLSSGEREVLNIAFDFQLRSPHDCIVFFDEPELHLHPELSYRLLQALQEIGENNQFIFATHSPDIISASLDRSVIFLSPPQVEADNSQRNQAILVSEGDSANRALQLLGQSIGIIALGRKIVLIEGTQASLDKQTYGSVLRNAYPSLVLVPSGGRHIIESFEAVYESVLSRSIWGVEFFMLCDGDSAPTTSDVSTQAISSGRLALLPRYHLENYFLDERIWAEALSPLDAPDAWTRDEAQVRERLRTIARSYVSYAVALRVAASVRYSFGNIDIMPADCHGRSLDELCAMFQHSCSAERVRFEGEMSGDSLISFVSDTYSALLQSLDDAADDKWKVAIPGRPILNTFAAAAGLKSARAKRLYLVAAEKVPNLDPFSEIRSIFETFAVGERTDDTIDDTAHPD
jgi:hypothetical protein